MFSTIMICQVCEEQWGIKVQTDWDISVVWQEVILHAPTTLGKTSADSYLIEILTNRFQIWTGRGFQKRSFKIKFSFLAQSLSEWQPF